MRKSVGGKKIEQKYQQWWPFVKHISYPWFILRPSLSHNNCFGGASVFRKWKSWCCPTRQTECTCWQCAACLLLAIIIIFVIVSVFKMWTWLKLAFQNEHEVRYQYLSWKKYLEISMRNNERFLCKQCFDDNKHFLRRSKEIVCGVNAFTAWWPSLLWWSPASPP